MRRLDQLLASLGYGSRREVREIVREGRVTVSGEVAEDFERRVLASSVEVDGLPLDAPDGVLALFHKPVGFVCSHSEAEGPSIYEILPPRWLQRNPVVSSIGRLDKDTSGLLLITDQGSLIQKLTSPRSEIEKVYQVVVDTEIPLAVADVFASGELILKSEEKPCLPAKLKITGPLTADLTILEGRYHQVRRMFASQGLHVTQLHRIRFGPYELGELPVSEWRLEPLPG